MGSLFDVLDIELLENCMDSSFRQRLALREEILPSKLYMSLSLGSIYLAAGIVSLKNMTLDGRIILK